MSHHNTVFSHRLKLIPEHEFETLAKQHHTGSAFGKALPWSQFVTMAMGQLCLGWDWKKLCNSLN
jgi:hypothetical protein